jgi:hypothetical protein
LADELIGQLPGDVLVFQPLAHERRKLLVEAAGFDQIGDDDWIRSGAGGAESAIAGHQFGINRVEPDLGAGGDERLQRTSHDETSMMNPRRFILLRTIAFG